MTIQHAYQQFCKNLLPVQDIREAGSIARIVFEDEFEIHNSERQDGFSLENQSRLDEIQKRLLNHEPVQYILGMSDFYGLKFKVTPDVLIPRQETEELVHWVLEEMRSRPGKHDLKLLDIGTGSGCIPVTVKKNRPILDVEALDISESALRIAMENARLNKVDVRFFQFDILKESLWKNLGKYDIIISNPPYIPYREMELMPQQVKSFEPENALFVDNQTPLIFYDKITELACRKLNEGGLLCFECNEFNAGEVIKILINKGFASIRLLKDMQGKDRIVKGIKEGTE